MITLYTCYSCLQSFSVRTPYSFSTCKGSSANNHYCIYGKFATYSQNIFNTQRRFAYHPIYHHTSICMSINRTKMITKPWSNLSNAIFTLQPPCTLPCLPWSYHVADARLHSNLFDALIWAAWGKEPQDFPQRMQCEEAEEVNMRMSVINMEATDVSNCSFIYYVLCVK